MKPRLIAAPFFTASNVQVREAPGDTGDTTDGYATGRRQALLEVGDELAFGDHRHTPATKGMGEF
jgi:hypothetical protein